MAASTDTDALTADAWVLLATDSVSGVVQHKGGGMVRINVGSASPTLETDEYLLIGSIGNLPSAFTWSGFTTGDDVYGRAHREDATVTTVAA